MQPKTFLLICQRVSESQQNKSKACAAATSASATDESPTARKTLTSKLMSHPLGESPNGQGHNVRDQPNSSIYADDESGRLLSYCMKLSSAPSELLRHLTICNFPQFCQDPPPKSWWSESGAPRGGLAPPQNPGRVLLVLDCVCLFDIFPNP